MWEEHSNKNKALRETVLEGLRNSKGGCGNPMGVPGNAMKMGVTRKDEIRKLVSGQI